MTDVIPKGTLKGLGTALILFVTGLMISFPQKTLGRDLGTGVVVAATSVAMMLVLSVIFMFAIRIKGGRASWKGLLYTSLLPSVIGMLLLSANGMYRLEITGYILCFSIYLFMLSCMKGARLL